MRKTAIRLADSAGGSRRTTAGGRNAAGLAALRTMPLDGNGEVESVRHVRSAALRHDGVVYRELPPRVAIKVRFRPGPGSNIRVEIWLPDAALWNGRLLGIGNGGAAGQIPVANLAWSIRAGHAVATTDMGTSAGAQCGVGNPDIWKDFGYRATHLMTVAAKRAVEAYYGRPPVFSYFVGGSTGGQQALQEAQRYPDDYDGIVAEVPAHCRTPLHAYFLWNHQILRRCPFTPEQEKGVAAAGNEFMAGREPPQTAGTAISDPRPADGDIDAIIALARRRDPSLTAAHGEALRELFRGPRHAVTGELIFNGVPPGALFLAATGNLYLFDWAFDGGKKYGDIDFAGDFEAYTARLGPYLNAENPDLSAFARRGGKLLMTSGTADPIVPYHATLDYYERTVEFFGSLAAVQAFFRYYLIPGRDHGRTGPGVNAMPDTLDVVGNWRENGIAPDGLDGRRVTDNGVLSYRVPLYPYPTRAIYDAAGRTFRPATGPRGGVGRIAARFLPPAEGK